MSTSQPSKPNDRTLLYLIAAVVGLWLAWKLLTFLYYTVCYLAVNLFLGLDVSVYGRLGWLGYSLAGLGLGAAAGAITAQRRFHLHRLISVGATGLILVLGSLLFIGRSPAEVMDNDDPQELTRFMQSQPSSTSTPVQAAQPTEEPPTAPLATADTVSEPAEGLMRVPAGADIYATEPGVGHNPIGYLHTNDTVRLQRRAGDWVRVTAQRDPLQPPLSGWLLRAQLAPLPPTTSAAKLEEPIHEAAALPPAEPTVPAASPSRPAVPAAIPAGAWPTGQQRHTGYIGEQVATFTLDWQPSGELTGSYSFDDVQPALLYRLTGTATASGELRLLEFTRSRLSARCLLQQQAGAYVGTMTTVDGRQLPMSLKVAQQ